MRVLPLTKRLVVFPSSGSGFTDYGFTEQVRNIHAMNETGADAVVLLTNRLACAGESDDVLLKRMDALLDAVDDTIDLGLYECPIPYKYLLTPKVLAHAAKTKRFYFIKDTCCNAKLDTRTASVDQRQHIEAFLTQIPLHC